MAFAPHRPDHALPLPLRTTASCTTGSASSTSRTEDKLALTTSGGISDSFNLSLTATASSEPGAAAVATAVPTPASTQPHHHTHRHRQSRADSQGDLHTPPSISDTRDSVDEYVDTEGVSMLPTSVPKDLPQTSGGSVASNSNSSTSPGAASGSPRRASKKISPSTTTAAAAAAAAMAAGVSGFSPILTGSGGCSSPSAGGGGGGGSPSSSTGCVRWCMNVALQSFTGEPWAVAIQPAAEDEFVLNGSFPGSPADSSSLPLAAAPVHPAATTTTAAANCIRQQPLPGSGPGNSITSVSGSNRSSPIHGPAATRMSPSMLRSGLQLAAIDYGEPQVQYPGGPVLDAAMFGYDPQSEDTAALHQCVLAVNSPPVTYGVDDLLGRITNVEFIAEQSSPEETAAGVPMHYRLASSLEPMLNATLNPAVTAVVDHCVSSMVLVYGATQEMKQMGLIGTPEECGLLPHGIRTMMDRFLERKEHQQSKASSASASPKSAADKSMSGSGTSGPVLASPPLKPSGTPSSPHGGDDAASDGEHTEGAASRSATSQAYSFVFPSIGSRHHRFVRMESTFIAFDSTSVVDLLDLSNKRVELVLKLAPPPTPSAFEEKTDDANTPSSSSATTDSFVLNARAMPVENTNDALSALDVGLENLSRALELSLLQSESGSSLLFSLTAFTDTCRCATMHVLCLAEDPAAQTWLASTVQARSQAIPLGEEQSWASIQNTPMPPPLHHHAATMLVPALCFGNMFTSVLICVYNSITALSRLNRDLTFAVTGYRMRTIPRVTLASSRRGLKKLPPSWEEYFTNDGRRYFIDTTTQTTTWEDPRFTYQQRSSRSGSSTGGSPGANGSTNAKGGAGPQHRPSRIGLGTGDKDFLANRLQQELHSNSSNATSSSSGGGSATTPPTKAVAKVQSPSGVVVAPAAVTGDEPMDIGIVVVDTMCRPRVLIGSSNPRFAQQYVEQERVLREKQHELEEATEAMRREAEKKRAAAASAAAAAAAAAAANAMTSSNTNSTVSSPGGLDDRDPIAVPVTATPSESVQTIADPAAPTRSTEASGIPATAVSGLIGLDDVDDEEVSSLCRSSSGNVDDFVFDDESDDDELKEAEAPLWSAAATSAGPTSSGSAGGTRLATESGIGSNAEARFYANALQEQAVGVVEMTAAAAAAPPSATSSMAASPLIGASGAGSSPAVTPDHRSASLAGELGASGNAIASVPPDVQDLESLVDEFTAFYRKAYAMQQRIVELEAELKKRKTSSQANTSFVLPRSLGEKEASVTSDVVKEMRKAVMASPSMEIQRVVLPLLPELNADSSSSCAIIAAFQETLRLAAQSSTTTEYS